ncbi:MAPEG family protein [Aliiglaciecola sp. M165]|uniref:MAPEG family protein n=1 Tax=Aliiglaciecola sp. M165 TaxID=2593649 RepID=UPI0011809C39|nr:MAPEG family protein [Aliiglaciecola sp. M165]TRY29376.1 hypothetical protein FM019_18430 [Aliiglaciecola sp. M165]
MHPNYIFWPVLAQIFLTLTLFIILGMRKTKAVKAGEVDRKKASLDNRVWPEDVVKVSNNIANQFETPVLFYILCLVIYLINAVDMVAMVLACLYAVSRYAHAYAHVGSNFVPMRFRIFLFGSAILIFMFIFVAWNLAASFTIT